MGDLACFLHEGGAPISTSLVAYILCGLIGALIGAGLLEVVRRQLATAKRTEAEDQAKQITQNAQREAETLIKEAKLESKDLIFQAKTDLEKEQKSFLIMTRGQWPRLNRLLFLIHLQIR
mgnify:CR=1 FL=1